VVNVDVMTVVEVEDAIVVVVEVDKGVVNDITVSVDGVESEVVVVDDVTTVDKGSSVDVVLRVDDGVDAKDVNVVNVELSIGVNMAALAKVTFDATPAAAKLRIITSTIRIGMEVMQVPPISLKAISLLYPLRSPFACLTTDCS